MEHTTWRDQNRRWRSSDGNDLVSDLGTQEYPIDATDPKCGTEALSGWSPATVARFSDITVVTCSNADVEEQESALRQPNRARRATAKVAQMVGRTARASRASLAEKRIALGRRIRPSGASTDKSERPRRRRVRTAARRLVPAPLREWDRADYSVVALAAALAVAADVLVVKTPKTSMLTKFMKGYDARTADDPLGRALRLLEKKCKVPFDTSKGSDGQRISGMYAKAHRFMTLGHDPVLRIIFGVRDNMDGTATGFAYDHAGQTHSCFHEAVPGADEDVKLIAAALRQIGHLLSDVATPMGLPAPFMTLLQGLNVGSFGEKERTVGEIARLMYVEGYDLRHYLAFGTVPGIVEIVLRAYIMLRHYSEHGAMPEDVTSTPKYRLMLKVAHGITTLGNATKVACMGGDPLAINVAEWQALARYVLPDVAYAIAAQGRTVADRVERQATKRWEQARSRVHKERPPIRQAATMQLAALMLLG